MERSAFIDDGYTVKGYIAAKAGMYPEVRFSFRQATVAQRASLIQRTTAVGDDLVKKEQLIAMALAEHLIDWEFEREITPNQVLKLHPDIFLRLASIVLYGSEASDIDPREKHEDADSIHREIEIALSDDPAATRQESDQKN